jgi:hypothetical protein
MAHPEPVAVVAFSGVAILPWLRLLRPGFRHCFVALRDEVGWLVLDPLAHQMRIVRAADAPPPAVAAHYRRLGLTALVVPVQAAPRRPAPFAPFTCVEAVKRVLGLHDRRIVTPWQLFRRLEKIALDFSSE